MYYWHYHCINWENKSRACPHRGFQNDAEDVACQARKNPRAKGKHARAYALSNTTSSKLLSRYFTHQYIEKFNVYWQHMANYKVTLWFPINRCTFHILFSYLLSIGWTSWWIVPTNYAEYNLLRWDMGNTNQEQASTEGEGLSPTLESLVILTSLRFIHIESPKLVNRRYALNLVVLLF
jgi:hypothetical protein